MLIDDTMIEALMSCAKAGATACPAVVPPKQSAAALAQAGRRLRCLSLVAGPISHLPQCPPELSDQLARVLVGTWATYTLTAASVTPVLDQARAAGIKVVVYKGAAQAARYYVDPSARPMTDIDLLVADQDKGGIREILERNRFRMLSTPGRDWTAKVSHEYTFAPPIDGSRMIDVHTSPTPPARYHLPVTAMLARSTPGVLFGVPVQFLMAEDELIVMATNQAFDHFRSGFVRFLDAWLITTRIAIDWDVVAENARAAGAAAAAWLTLTLAEQIAGVPVPRAVLTRLRPPLARRLWLAALLDTRGMGEPRRQLSRRLEQLLLVYPLIDDTRGFLRFAGFHGRLRLLDASQQLMDLWTKGRPRS
ncbi:MAG: nucleotidyltransferase family protein [Myxococcales bacterium]